MFKKKIILIMKKLLKFKQSKNVKKNLRNVVTYKTFYNIGFSACNVSHKPHLNASLFV